jgi:hypothetical protein
MATREQLDAARRSVTRAQQAARRKRTIASLPQATRRELARQAARGRRRGGELGRALRQAS